LARGGIEPVADALAGYALVTNDDVRRIGERIFTAPRTAVRVGPLS
jgi:hypothetical protein